MEFFMLSNMHMVKVVSKDTLRRFTCVPYYDSICAEKKCKDKLLFQ